MPAFTKRSSHRNHYESPIRYANINTDLYSDARMYNYSKDGMYFEPSRPLVPESEIYIVMVNYSPGTNGPEAYKSYIARIRWCRELQKKDALRYGVGVQFLDRSHEIYGLDIEDTQYSCDLCGQLTPSNKIHKTEDYIYLCPDCLKYLNVVPGGKIKDSIERFLIGNVI